MVSDHYLASMQEFDENKQPSSLMSDEFLIHAQMLAVECKAVDVPFLDLTAFLREREARVERMYWEYDEHMKASSYLLIGQQIYQFWNGTGES